MTRKYKILHNGRAIGRAFSTLDEADPTRKNVSVMPVDRSGSFADETLEFSVTELCTESFAVSTLDQEAVGELLGLVKIEPSKVTIVEIGPDD